MMEGGPILEYVEALLSRPDATLVFTGFASPSTIAGKLLEFSRLDAMDRDRRTDALAWHDAAGQYHELPLAHVRCDFRRVRGYTGHADQRQLVNWVVREHKGKPLLAAPVVFLVHGSPNARTVLASELYTAVGAMREARAADFPTFGDGFRVALPTRENTWFDLDVGDWIIDEPNERASLRGTVRRLQQENARLRRENEGLRAELTQVRECG